MIDFDRIPTCELTRATELMILIQASLNGSFAQVGPELRASWQRQLEALAGKESVDEWLKYLSTRMLDNGEKLLTLIDEYRNGRELLYELNFSSSKYFSECALSERIGLLYQIGSEAGLLKPSETFDNHTRVTQTQQDVCDRVVGWVNKSLQISLEPVNVYASFIYDYQQYKHKRERSLYEIGIRAGLLEDKPEGQLTQSDQAKVVAWVKNTFDIALNESSETPEGDELETPNIERVESTESINLVRPAKSGRWARRASMNGLMLLLIIVPVGGLLYQYVAQSQQSYSSELPKLASEVALGEQRAKSMQSIQPRKCP